jgi:hypothetical protein
VIENWAVLEEMPQLPRENNWSRSQEFERRPILLYSGTLGMKHRPDLLYLLAEQLKDECTVVIITDGIGQECPEKMSLKNLRILPFQPYEILPEVLASADVLLATLDIDAGKFAVPSKILTYMCAGRPILFAGPRENLCAAIIQRSGGGLVGSPNTRFLKRLHITRELLERLPRVSWQYVKCHGGVTEVIAFQGLGFRTYVQFTHELAPHPVSVLWRQMRNKTRNVIRRAEERFSVSELGDPIEFLGFFERNLKLEGQINGLDWTLCRKILSASLERRRGRILAARDKNDQIVAANFCVWDEISSFYLMSTRSHDSGNGAIALLIWEAIKHSARRGLIFDFAGLGNKGSILLYSGFGARVCSRFAALRARPMARMIYELKCLAAPENCFY